MTLKEFDSLSRKRISRIISIQEKKLEQEREIKERQFKEAEQRAKRENHNKGSKNKY